jgi:hypothetical protein
MIEKEFIFVSLKPILKNLISKDKKFYRAFSGKKGKFLKSLCNIKVLFQEIMRHESLCQTAK